MNYEGVEVWVYVKGERAAASVHKWQVHTFGQTCINPSGLGDLTPQHAQVRFPGSLRIFDSSFTSAILSESLLVLFLLYLIYEYLSVALHI